MQFYTKCKTSWCSFLTFEVFLNTSMFCRPEHIKRWSFRYAAQRRKPEKVNCFHTFTVYFLHLIHSWLGCKKTAILLECDKFSLKPMCMTWFILTNIGFDLYLLHLIHSFDLYLLHLIHSLLGCKQTGWCSRCCFRHRRRWRTASTIGAQGPIQ